MEKPTTMSLRYLVACLMFVIAQVEGFYIPGWSIKSYQPHTPLPLLVNKLTSSRTQLQYAYYSLPFVCPPAGRSVHHPGGLLSGQSIPLNLGEVLRGDRIAVSDMELSMRDDVQCRQLCTREVGREDVELARRLVKEGYLVEWILDNLPAATRLVSVDGSRRYYAAGFKLGTVEGERARRGEKVWLNNHFTIMGRYRRAPGRDGERGGLVIVGFEVYAKSVEGGGCEGEGEGLELRLGEGNGTDGETLRVPYTYSVYWREDNSIEWNRRWDLYFVNQEEGSKIHWLAIVNSAIICGLLTGVVMMILTRTIRTDIKKGSGAGEEGKMRLPTSKKSKRAENGLGLLDQGGEADQDGIDDASDDGEALEDITGWKLLHADVFRPPAYGHILAPLVGSGMQFLFMAVGLVLLSALGVLNPSFRGGFISFGVGLFVFAGLFSGYFSARVYKTFDGQDWRRNMVVTAVLFPGLMFGFVFVLNLFVWAQASSTALPFGTLIAIVLLWLGVQLPLVYVGSWYGYVKSGAWEHPTKTAAIPRQVPRQAWYIRGTRTVLLAGLIPFAVIFIELLFVFQSVWQDKSGYYYVFGFLAVVSAILVATIAEVTVVTIYMQLCAENYHWWWQSFLVGGGSAVWVFAYCVWYYFTKLHITGFVSSMLFFSYSFMACCVYGLLTGTVGFLTAYAFVRRIYGAIKAD